VGTTTIEPESWSGFKDAARWFSNLLQMMSISHSDVEEHSLNPLDMLAAWLLLQEVVSVLWLLVRLRHIRHLKLQQHLDLRDSLAQQYQHHLHSIDQQLQQLQQQQRQTQQQKQRRRLQQHKLVLLQQLPLLTHAAVLLACARLGLKAHRQLHAGTCQLVCKVSDMDVVFKLSCGVDAERHGERGCAFTQYKCFIFCTHSVHPDRQR